MSNYVKYRDVCRTSVCDTPPSLRPCMHACIHPYPSFLPSFLPASQPASHACIICLCVYIQILLLSSTFHHWVELLHSYLPSYLPLLASCLPPCLPAHLVICLASKQPTHVPAFDFPERYRYLERYCIAEFLTFPELCNQMPGL